MNGAIHGAGEAAYGDPVAGPVVSSTPSVSPLVNESSASVPSGNDGAHTGTTPSARPRRRLSAADIDRIADRLSDRDRAILASVDEHQFLTVRQIEGLHFAAISSNARNRIARRVLNRLRGLRVLDTLDRRIGGTRAGSAGLIFHVGVAGDRMLARKTNRRRTGRLRFDPSPRFVNHRLAIADAHVALVVAHRAGDVDLVDGAVEPASWRRFTGIGSARRILKPDLYAETASTDDLVSAWFIEVDLGTEHIPTLLTKCREYEAYRQTGFEQSEHGAFPLVVWSVTHANTERAERRRQDLTDAIAADRRLPTALFRVVAPEDLLPLLGTGGLR
ncbi:hypothetical protein EF294_03615 [Gordonia oryzae]|uniref:Replication-relaxation n=1 Tax=Gordonia oryzae TaxID=2487349 RepID=A0A3N4GWN0_9ACTN|nr:replication-relaxation family protein [Gordonia oryzae]RPA65837.1 hypothetical protein EF294_03615 [Gordonia oryzae]